MRILGSIGEDGWSTGAIQQCRRRLREEVRAAWPEAQTNYAPKEHKPPFLQTRLLGNNAALLVEPRLLLRTTSHFRRTSGALWRQQTMAMYQQLTEHSHATMQGRHPLAPYFPPALTEALMTLFSVARTVGAPPWMAGTPSGPTDPDGPVLVYPPAHKDSVISICREAGQVLKRSRTAQRTVAILPQWDGQPLGHWVHSTGGKVAIKVPQHRVPRVGYKQILGQAPISRLQQFCSPTPM